MPCSYCYQCEFSLPSSSVLSSAIRHTLLSTRFVDHTEVLHTSLSSSQLRRRSITAPSCGYRKCSGQHTCEYISQSPDLTTERVMQQQVPGKSASAAMVYTCFTKNSITFNTLWPRQNDRHFADYNFESIFVNENVVFCLFDWSLFLRSDW